MVFIKATSQSAILGTIKRHVLLFGTVFFPACAIVKFPSTLEKEHNAQKSFPKTCSFIRDSFAFAGHFSVPSFFYSGQERLHLHKPAQLP